MNHDRQLQQDVLAELRWEPRVTEADIGVTVNDGTVTLLGHVGSFLEKYSAERAAQRVRGVKTVVDELEVHLFENAERTDEELLSAAQNRLQWDTCVPHDSIRVSVQNGRVTLTGRVDWHFQRDAAEKNIRALTGVVAVANEIEMNPTVNAENVRSDITQALHRSWFNPNQIAVCTDGGQVTLTGTVTSWPDYALAGRTAWSARGTTAVHNHIVVV